MGIKQLAARMVGVDIFDLDACKANGIIVTNVPIYSPRAIAEMGVTQAMYLLRRIGEFEQRMSHGDFRWSDDLISNEIYNLTVGIVGLGNIGGATAQIYKALGAKVLAMIHHTMSNMNHTLNIPISILLLRMRIFCHCIHRCYQVPKT